MFAVRVRLLGGHDWDYRGSCPGSGQFIRSGALDAQFSEIIRAPSMTAGRGDQRTESVHTSRGPRPELRT